LSIIPLTIFHLPLAHLPIARSVTLSIFPGVLAEDVHSAQLGSWYPIWLIAAFNLADAAGKAAPGWAALRLRYAG
jgi:equilibrative nucleoside transporter 1/2/3